MKKNYTIVNSVNYLLEAWVKFVGGEYRFRIKATPAKGQPYIFQCPILREFIDDNINNNKNLEYLEKVFLKMSENHLEDFIKIYPNIPHNFYHWLKEAKQQIGKTE